MDNQHAIYTTQTTCQDCYRCVRTCPVKAIRVDNGHAAIDPEQCVACGACVDACPSGAKTVREDLGRAQALLTRKEKVYASLAPSFAGEFQNTTEEELIRALQDLGFAGVSETAIGADLVTQAVAGDLRKLERKLYLSTACPAAVDFVRMYMPEHADSLTQRFSPMLAHARLLKETYGPECGVVFIGPCIAKKREADRHKNLVDVALTFKELRKWMEQDAPTVDPMDERPATFVPYSAENGAIYPVSGGMVSTLEPYDIDDVQMLTVSGLTTIEHYLRTLDPDTLPAPVFIELLACPGGCIAGPCADREKPMLLNETAVRSFAGAMKPPAPLELPRIEQVFTPQPQASHSDPDEALKAALARIGKYTREDELNCGACGYDSCRDCAAAMIAGRAEPNMCVSYLRQRAQRKANALLRCMPSGVVIVDKNLRIVECNKNFAAIAGQDAESVFDARPGLAEARLDRILPFHDHFREVLETGQQYDCEMLRWENRLLSVTVFEIEPQQTVGGIILDVTSSGLRREQIVERARDVIDRNMTTVQEIACKLGENMAETEILLRTITEDFAEQSVHEG